MLSPQSQCFFAVFFAYRSSAVLLRKKQPKTTLMRPSPSPFKTNAGLSEVGVGIQSRSGAGGKPIEEPTGSTLGGMAEPADGHSALTLNDAKRLTKSWIDTTTGSLLILVARCNMCLCRCPYDAGIPDQLPQLYADITAHAADNPLSETICTELLAMLALVGERGVSGTRAHNEYCYHFTSAN